ncbi:cadherin-related family member 4-like isoform X2 [Scyliorhinus torazame]|uniref:cadherin-related family member 4-like isoform X2 n=1 Tax=Scyliorhinus torazame TaxID=75743 RepID=UPI003B5B7685
MDLSSVSRLLPLLLIFWDNFSDGQQIVVENFESIATVPENSPAGTKIHEFQAIVFNDAVLEIAVTSTPESEFFMITYRRILRTEILNRYIVETFLSTKASLDYEWAPIYLLTITINGYNLPIHFEQLQLLIQDVADEHCGIQFQTPGGATVRVEETAAPLSQIYTIVSAPSPAENFIYTITEAVPASAEDEFSVDQSGSINVPFSGFEHRNEERIFELHIRVTQNTDTICTGTLRIVVIPVNHRPPIFTSVSMAVSIPENQGPEYYVATLTATGDRIHYHLKDFNPSFQIGEATGIIKTSYNLDLDQKPGLAVNLLVIVAFDDSYLYSSLANVTVYVTDVNDNDPRCTPPILVADIPETTPVETTLFDLTCSDPDYSKTNLSYTIVANENSYFKFKYHASSVKVNESLDYDSAKMANLDFQYRAAVIVTDGGTPPRTTTVSMLVTVTQVNEFPPVFHGIKTFSVPENSPVNTLVGIVNATDADWVYNNVRFSIVGHDPPTFYIHPDIGQINTLVLLDFEKIDTYILTIQAVDMNYNVLFDSSQQRTTYAQYTINVENVNDVPPVCNPPFYKETIYSTLADSISIVTLSCTDKDSSFLNYRIVGGNINNRFISQRDSLFSKNTFSYNPDGISDPTIFELQIEVTDDNGADSKLTLTTTVIVIVHVIPWTTTVPTTTAPLTTRTPINKMVTVLNNYWKPEAWFVVVLTLVSALAAVALALLLWNCRSRISCCKQSSPQSEMSRHLLQARSRSQAGTQKGNEIGEKKQLPSETPLGQVSKMV